MEYVRKIGRLRGSFHGVYRLGWVEPASFVPVLFMPGSDTHGNVYENLTCRTEPKTQLYTVTSYVKEEKQWQLKKK